jgi:aldehyde:ferredoxin oxidoreductase
MMKGAPMKGYTGKILFVDLSSGEIKNESIADAVYEMLLSGVGLGAYVLYNRIPAGADALGPENVLGFVSGLLTGTPSVITGRWMVVCKSPLTGGWGDANCGGTFSPAIKQCGYDGIFFSGISKEPVYLYVDTKGAELRSAAHVWGQDAVIAEEMLVRENTKRKKPVVAVIGPAAEKLSLISGICNDGGRIAARSGCGAVMGSKRLKAVVLAGTRFIGCQDPQTMKTISKELAAKVRKQNVPRMIPGAIFPLMGKVMGGMKKAASMDGMVSVLLMKRWGTIMNNTLGVTSGDTPLKNWAGSVVDYNFTYYKNLNPDRVTRLEVKKYHCYSCIIGCGGVCDVSKATRGEFNQTHKPEYETCAAFGGLVMNKDLDAICTINELLNRAGMDSISAGGTVAFAIECYQRGILTREMTDGLELSWGNSTAIVALVRKMIAREGIGGLLADGSKAAAARIGALAQPYAITAGGQEPGMHDARMDPLLGIHFSADPTPGRHTVGSGQYYDLMQLWEKVSWAPNPGSYLKADEYIPTEKIALKSVANSCYKELTDAVGGCLFAMVLGVNHWKLFEWVNAATGWQKTPDEYMEIGRRIQTLRQLFNIKQGVDPMSFKMSPRMAGDPPLQAGPNKGKTVPIEEMMHMHWKAFGWDERTGAPLPEVIRQMQMDQIILEGA